MSTYKVYLIRHGKTTANEKHLYCGHTDLPLSEAGKRGILDLKSAGFYPRADLFFTSGLARTTQTLSLIYGDVPFQCVPAIREYYFGDFEMKSYEELKTHADYQAWIMDETGEIACPGGESKNAFCQRVLHGFEEVVQAVQAANAPAAIICHGGVIATVMGNLFPNQKNFYEWQPAAGHGYLVLSHDSLEDRDMFAMQQATHGCKPTRSYQVLTGIG